jgi:hypothetical protein
MAIYRENIAQFMLLICSCLSTLVRLSLMLEENHYAIKIKFNDAREARRALIEMFLLPSAERMFFSVISSAPRWPLFLKQLASGMESSAQGKFIIFPNFSRNNSSGLASVRCSL